jgi:hypothetical protein
MVVSAVPAGVALSDLALPWIVELTGCSSPV